MNAITINGLEPYLIGRLEQVARQEGKSINEVILEMIKQCLDTENKDNFNMIYHDMDHLFGKWSEEEFNRIQGKIDSERKIDKELW